MTTQHTQGEWKWWDENSAKDPRPKNYDLMKLIGANGRVILSCYGGSGKYALGKTKEDIANARLIAAAPQTIAERDMLIEQATSLKAALVKAEKINAKLLEALEFVRKYPQYLDSTPWGRSALDKMDAAIAASKP